MLNGLLVCVPPKVLSRDFVLSSLVPLRCRLGRCKDMTWVASDKNGLGNGAFGLIWCMMLLASVSRLELPLPGHHFPDRCAVATAVEISASSRSAQYPWGNHTHSKPSLAGLGGSRPYEDIGGLLDVAVEVRSRMLRLATTPEVWARGGETAEGKRLVGPSMAETLREMRRCYRSTWMASRWRSHCCLGLTRSSSSFSYMAEKGVGRSNVVRMQVP